MSKAKTTNNNPIDALYSQSKLYFEFVCDYEYKVLLDTNSLRAKVEMPSGTVFDEEFEYYFQEDDLYENHHEFEQWFKGLLMSIEFFHSETWEMKKSSK